MVLSTAGRCIVHSLIALSFIVFQLGAQTGQARRDTLVKLAASARHPAGGTLVRELVIGSENAGRNYVFTQISDVLVARDATIWICDGSFQEAFQCRRFSASGQYIDTPARAGQGPGEIERSAGIAQLPDGRVLLRDSRARINVYDIAGKSIATWVIPDVMAPWFTRAIATDTAGFVHVILSNEYGLSVPVQPEFAFTLRLDKNGAVVDTIPNPALPSVRLREPWAMVRLAQVTFSRQIPLPDRPGMARRNHDVPYSPSVAWHWNPFGQMVTVVSSRYTLDVRVPESKPGSPDSTTPGWRAGDRVTSIRRNIDAASMSSEERAARLRILNEGIARNSIDRKVQDPLSDLPMTKPFIADVQFGMDGRIWVRRFGPSVRVPIDPALCCNPGWRDTFFYDVFERDGSFVGSISLPNNLELKTMNGDTVWAVHTDIDEVETLQKLRVVWK